MAEQFSVEWMDRYAEPKCAPDLNYPTGIDLDATNGNEPSCIVTLPYPAKRIGFYSIKCFLCGLTAACTTAGRRDDPRSMKLACKTNAAIPEQ